MASDFVRSLKDIRNINKLSKNLVEENDIISTIDGKRYIATKTGFIEMSTTENFNQLNELINRIKQDVTTNKSNITRNKNNIATNTSTIQSQSEQIETNKDNIATNTSDIKQLKDTQQKQETNINNLVSDTGWQDLTLSEGVTAYSDYPQYRIIHIGSVMEIALRGSVKGLTENNKTVIAKLPIDEELSNPHYFVQNVSKKSGQIGYVRWTIQRDGNITYEGSSHDTSLLDGSEWNPINTTFKN